MQKGTKRKEGGLVREGNTKMNEYLGSLTGPKQTFSRDFGLQAQH